jgi:hypothetical protein
LRDSSFGYSDSEELKQRENEYHGRTVNEEKVEVVNESSTTVPPQD